MATYIPFQRFSLSLPQIKARIHRPLLPKKPAKAYSHFNILPHTMPYGVSFATLGTNASNKSFQIKNIAINSYNKNNNKNYPSRFQ